MLLSGRAPFFGDSDSDIFAAIKKGKFSMDGKTWDGVTENGKKFVKYLLTLDYKKRPTAAECLNHRWMKTDEKVNKNAAADVLMNLQSFKTTHFLQQATYGYMSSQLMKKSERERLSELFRAFDKNNDGKIDKGELK